MKTKKLVSLILALVMVFCISASAFADGYGVDAYKVENGSKKLELAGETKVPVLTVFVENTGLGVILNPYQMTVTPTGMSQTSNQVISRGHFIANLTQAPVNVGVTAKATPSTGVSLLSKAPTVKDTDKAALLFLAMKNLESTVTTDAAAFAAAEAYTATFDAAATKTGSQVLFDTAGTDRTDPLKPVLTLAKATSDTTPTYAAFKVFGEVVKTPESSWTSSDKIDLTISFSFNIAAITA